MADEMTVRPFRFGVGMKTPASRSVFVEKCRKAEDLGYDVISVADHLGLLAPFPSVMLAAEVTRRPRLATSVLNASFYNPALLAREVACVDQLTNGRIELGLGAGYVRSEFDAAGLPWPEPGKRIDHLERTVSEVRSFLSKSVYGLEPMQHPSPPLWLAGRGNRMLRLAAREADIIGFSGYSPPINDGQMGQLDNVDRIAERVDFVRSALGSRVSEVEFNILVQRVIVTRNRRATARDLEPVWSLNAAEMLEAPSILIGTPRQIADQLTECRERFGFSYVSVAENKLESLAPVIELFH